MKLYDEVIASWFSLLEKQSFRELEVDYEEKWPDEGKNNLVLPFEMAFELGGSRIPLVASGVTAVTSDKSLVDHDQILLYGKDLAEVKKETPYVRLAVCLVDDREIGEKDGLFNTIKAIEYVRYHVNPRGFMMRVSAAQKRESVRVSTEAIENGISFKNAGSLMIKAYRKNPKVKAVKLIFINEESFDFDAMQKEVRRCGDITMAIDHIGNTPVMECNTCGLKKVCDEVEGMKELHFGNS